MKYLSYLAAKLVVGAGAMYLLWQAMVLLIPESSETLYYREVFDKSRFGHDLWWSFAVLVFGLIALGLLMSTYALSTSLVLSCVLIFISGAVLIAVFAMVTSLVQLLTRDEMRGRVMSVYNVAFRGGMPFGSLITGALIKNYSAPPVLAVNGLILVGLGFKISAVPFHFWAPDVYQGAPTPIAGFLSTASKAAGFAVVLRLFAAAFPDFSPSWQMILAVLSVLSMTIGNLLALAQSNIKRLLAYSSIAHAGYALIGVVAFSQLGTLSTVFYLAAYILTNLAAFGIVAIIANGGQVREEGAIFLIAFMLFPSALIAAGVVRRIRRRNAAA